MITTQALAGQLSEWITLNLYGHYYMEYAWTDYGYMYPVFWKKSSKSGILARKLAVLYGFAQTCNLSTGTQVMHEPLVRTVYVLILMLWMKKYIHRLFFKKFYKVIYMCNYSWQMTLVHCRWVNVQLSLIIVGGPFSME